MLKNAYFLKRTVKNLFSVSRLPPAAGGSAPTTLRCYLRLLLQLVEFISSAKCVLLSS